MRNHVCILCLIVAFNFLSCVTSKPQAPRKESLYTQPKIEGQHRVVYGQYAPPDLDIKDFQKVFGAKNILNWKKISGGFSGAKLYQVDVSGHSYIVRSTGGLFGKAGIGQELALMQLASDFKIAPKVYYMDSTSGVVAMDKINNVVPNLFAPGILKAWPDLLAEIAGLMREIHKLKPDREIVTNRYFDAYFSDLVKNIRKDTLDSSDRAILEKFSAKKWPRGREVLSHNDLHARNLLYDGKKLYLIDWEMAGFGPEFYDLAIFTNMQAMTNEEGKNFFELIPRKASVKSRIRRIRCYATITSRYSGNLYPFR